MAKVNKKVLNEFRYYTGLLQEQGDHALISNMIPGLKNAVDACKEMTSDLEEVVSRLEKLEKILQADENQLHLPAESSYLHSKLRNALHKVLGAEAPIRSALSKLDSLS